MYRLGRCDALKLVQVHWGSECEPEFLSGSIRFRFKVQVNGRTGPKVRFSVRRNMR
jgi:hypothetical protein